MDPKGRLFYFVKAHPVFPLKWLTDWLLDIPTELSVDFFFYKLQVWVCWADIS